jgi:hypothetical protein
VNGKPNSTGIGPALEVRYILYLCKCNRICTHMVWFVGTKWDLHGHREKSDHFFCAHIWCNNGQFYCLFSWVGIQVGNALQKENWKKI